MFHALFHGPVQLAPWIGACPSTAELKRGVRRIMTNMNADRRPIFFITSGRKNRPFSLFKANETDSLDVLSRNKIIYVVVFAAVALAGVFLFFALIRPPSSGLEQNRISFPEGVGLCSHSSIYPNPPYLLATILVNGNSPLSSIDLTINGTYEGSAYFRFNMTSYVTSFNLNPNNPSLPILAGKTYGLTFVATFRDESTYTATASTIAC